MQIKDEIKKLEENHSQRAEIIADGDCFDTADIWDDFEKALKIINNLMKVVKMQQKTIKSAKELRDWIAEKSSSACYEIEELKQTPEKSKALQEIFGSQHDGLMACYRDEFYEALEKSKQLLEGQ